ncbi:hypothetical protein SMICM304S_02442 [Streptomyces microflavus]
MTTGNGAGTESGGAAAPTEIERALAGAVAGGGGDAVVELLARTRLDPLLVARLHADIPGWTAPLPTIRDEATRRTCVPVLTPGMLPPWHSEWVFREVSLGRAGPDLADTTCAGSR